MDFELIFGGFLVDFGLILARFLADVPSIFGQVSGRCFARFLIIFSTIFDLLARFLVDCSSAVAGTQLCCALDILHNATRVGRNPMLRAYSLLLTCLHAYMLTCLPTCMLERWQDSCLHACILTCVHAYMHVRTCLHAYML